MAKHPRRMSEDGKNAMILAFIEGLSNRVCDEAEALKAELDDEESPPFDMPVSDRGIRVFLVHSMGLSFIEACAVLLLDDAIYREKEPVCTQLLEYARDNRVYSRYVEDEETREKELEALLDYLYTTRSSMGDYERLLKHSGLLEEDLIERVGDVRDTRGGFIHSPETLINLRTGAEVKTVVDECVAVVNEVEEICRDEVALHELYHHFTDYEHK